MPIQQLFNALTLGSTYSLVALGYTLVFGTLGVVNMAHGEVFMAAAFVGLWLTNTLGVPVGLALLGAVAAGCFLGVLLEWVALSPMRRHPEIATLATLISTMGFGILLQNLFLTFVGPESRTFATPFKEVAWHIGGLTVTAVDLLMIAVAVVIMIGLHLALSRTKLGKAIRAVAENRVAASLLGIDVKRINMAAVAVASGIGGAAGMLVGLAFAVHPTMGLPYGVKGLAIIVLGGMGSVPGAMAGGLLLALVEVLTIQFIAASWRDAAAFAVLFILLVVRPGGLFGRPFGQVRA